MRTTDVIAALAIVALLISVAMIGDWDADAATAEQSRYCSMVETWSAHQHIAPEHRPGWPPFKGECE